MLVLALGGFWPQYLSAALGRVPAETTQFWLIHLHAGLFTVWLLFFISQASLIMTGFARVHVRLGPWLLRRWHGRTRCGDAHHRPDG